MASVTFTDQGPTFFITALGARASQAEVRKTGMVSLSIEEARKIAKLLKLIDTDDQADDRLHAAKIAAQGPPPRSWTKYSWRG